jgi:hypothetical protein
VPLYFYNLVFALYSAPSRMNVTSALMVPPHTWHINMQLSPYNFISILYFKIDFKHFKLYVLYLWMKLLWCSVLQSTPPWGWPRHVAGYAVHNTINLHTCICTWSYYFHCLLVAIIWTNRKSPPLDCAPTHDFTVVSVPELYCLTTYAIELFTQRTSCLFYRMLW